ncbi:MAG: hypothetical protein JXA24_06210 [Proteobacteria bacterium]|nr:hypothetical protein [Pseudomonadota bacterium]
MWSLIKWLFLLAVIAIIALALTGKKIRGKTIEEYFGPVMQSKAVKEGLKDIRSIVGEGLKAAGEAISEDVTDEEKRQLDRVLEQELKAGAPVHMPPDQQALTPQVKENAKVEAKSQPRPSLQQMQAMPPKPGAGSNNNTVQERPIGDR